MNYYNYFTEIEEHFVRRRGKHLYISPMDWSLISTWRDSGVPLHLALRGIDKAMDTFYTKQRRPERVHTLFYCHEAVMAEYASYLESRVGEGEPGEKAAEAAETAQEGAAESREPGRQAILRFLDVRILEIKSLLEKHYGQTNELFREAMERVHSRLEEILCDLRKEGSLEYESLERDLSILEETLVRELRAYSPPERLSAWEEEAKKELKVYKKRLPKETYLKIQDSFLRGKIHAHFKVGELSLFHL